MRFPHVNRWFSSLLDDLKVATVLLALPIFTIAAIVGLASAMVLARGSWHARHQV